MRKARNLIGMPVVVDNRRIGRVIQIELSDDWTSLSGLWVDTGLRGTRFIPSESLGTLGAIAIIADNRGERKRMKDYALFRRAIGTDGQRLGAITGAEIDELSFRIEALELSFGFWDDLMRGRRRIHSFILNRENGDVLIGAGQTVKEADNHEERYDEGADHGRTDRRFGSSDVRHRKLAGSAQHELSDEEDRSLNLQQGR